MEDKTKSKKLNIRQNYFDFSLLFVVIFLLCFGLVMIYSASSYNAQFKYDDSLYYLKKQLFATLAGLGIMGIMILIGHEKIRKLSWVIYVTSLISIVLVLTPLGFESNGARRWLNLGISFQPAEYAKMAIIIFMAYMISRHIRHIERFANILRFIGIALLPTGMIAVITENLSSAIIIFAIAFVMLFIASPRWFQFVIPLLAGGLMIALFLKTGAGFRANRIRVWRHPEDFASSGGYQVLQGLYAIGSGGLFGKGLGQSVQKLGFVPEAQNDYIFTIICEELGLFGAVAVILLFVFMMWRFMIIANNAPDLYSALLVTGVMTHIAIQVILNIAVVTNSIPNTGVTLPFISYGGTSVVFLLAEVGLVLSVSRSIKLQ